MATPPPPLPPMPPRHVSCGSLLQELQVRPPLRRTVLLSLFDLRLCADWILGFTFLADDSSCYVSWWLVDKGVCVCVCRGKMGVLWHIIWVSGLRNFGLSWFPFLLLY
jgi:hypothetical protein